MARLPITHLSMMRAIWGNRCVSPRNSTRHFILCSRTGTIQTGRCHRVPRDCSGALEWHLDHLTEQNLIEKHRDANNHVTLVTAEPAEVARLLDEITPSLPDRMIDRFTRPVDNLLAEGS
jgi:hypothetical protein